MGENVMAKFCSECGKELEDGEVFCTKCGAKAGGTNNSVANVENSVQNLSNMDNKKKIIIAVAAVVVILFGFLAFGSGDSSKSSSKAALTVKAEEVMEDYIRDQGTAESKYKDKKVNITGKVLHKDQFSNSNDFSLLLSGTHAAGRTYQVLVAVPSDKVEIVNKAEEGKFISVQGTCVGIVKQDDPTKVSVQIKAEKINQ